MSRKHLTIFIVILVGWAVHISYGQTTSTMEVVSQATDQFPAIHFTLRIQQSNYNSPTALSRDQLTIGEAHNSNSISINTSESTLATAIIIDTTVINEREKALYREVLNYYVNTIHRAGDQLFVIGVSHEQPLVFTNQTSISRFFDEFSHFPQTFTNFPNGNQLRRAFEIAVAQLEPLMATNTAQIIYLYSYVGNSSYGAVQFAHPRIPTYLIRASYYTRGVTNELDHLATGGKYELTYNDNTNVQSLVRTRLSPLATRLTQNRTLFEVSYVSRQAYVGERLVPITVQLPNEQLTTQLIYQRDVAPPRIILSDSVGNTNYSTITRQAQAQHTLQGQTGTIYSNPSETLVVTVSFPDNLPRSNLVAYLIIDGQMQPVPYQALLDGSNQFRIVWDLSQFEQEGTVKRTVAVTVNDEYGLSSTSNSLDYTIVVEKPIITTETVLIDECADPTAPTYDALRCGVKEQAPFVLGGYVLVGLVIIVLSGIVVTQHKRIGALASSASSQIGRLSKGVFNNTIGRLSQIRYEDSNTTQISSPWGQPTVNISQPNTFQPNEIDPPTQQYSPTGTQIDEGQNATMVDIPRPTKNISARFIVTGIPNLPVIDIPKGYEEFIVGRERSHGCHCIINEPRVSAHHFTLFYDYGKRQFYVQNFSKTNGLRVNGKELEYKQTIAVNNGDILRLTRQEPYIELRFVNYHEQNITPHTLMEVRRDVNMDDHSDKAYLTDQSNNDWVFGKYLDELLDTKTSDAHTDDIGRTSWSDAKHDAQKPDSPPTSNPNKPWDPDWD